MRKKGSTAKRCQAGNCNKVIAARFNYCFEHKNLARMPVTPKMENRKRFYCVGCGTVAHVASEINCHLCGKKMELVDE